MALTTQLSKGAATVAFFALAGTSQAAITTYTTSGAFTAAVGNVATDSFDSLGVGFIDAPLTRTTGSYGYTASAPFGLYGTGTVTDVWLSINDASETLTFNGFTGGVKGVGGLFFGTDYDGLFASGQTLTLVATDSLGASASQVITGATLSSFRGFVSTGTMSSLTVSILEGDINGTFATTNNLMLAAAVPEPGTYAMLLAGLVGIGAVMRRRR